MAWNGCFVFISSIWLVNSMESYYQPPRGSSVWGYFIPPLLHREPLRPRQSPMEAMVDLTNNLGVAILQDHTFSRGNFAFSPYGVASVLVVLYEGARGESARQIHRAVGFPLDKDLIRIGFRDIHRHLRSYFSHEGYLSGISLNKETSSLKPEYKKILRFYGYDVELNQSVDEEDDDVDFEKPPAHVPSAPPPVTCPPQLMTNSSQDNDKNVGKPDAESEKTNNTIQTTVPPTDHPKNVTKPGQNSTQHEATTETSLMENSKPSQNTTERHSEQMTEATIPPTTTVTPDIVTELPNKEEMTEDDEKDKRELTTTEKIKTTAAEKITTTEKTKTTAAEKITTTEKTKTTAADEMTTTEKIKATTAEEITTTEKVKATVPEQITTTTESVMVNVTEDESYITSTVKNDSNNTKQGEVTEGKQGDFLMIEGSTTEKSEDNTNVPNIQEQQLEPTTVTTMQSETETEIPTAAEEMTTESDKATEVTNSNLDNGMLIPQSDDLVTAAPTGKESTGTDSPDVSSSATEPTTENYKGTADESPKSLTGIQDQFRGKNVIRVSGTRSKPSDNKKIRNIIDPKMHLWLSDTPKNSKRRISRTITDYLKSPRSPDLSLQLQNGMYDTHVSRNANLYRSLPRLLFLVDGSVDTPVPMMTYTNIFPYAYIPKLHSKALEFPLDDIRYKLVIILPVERRGLRQLIYDMLDYPLSNVLQTMRPARVKALVPTFMVEGFVILTSSLQKLGIWDVFDPRKANLSGMSMDPELYVRNVEQSVTVVIRNYVEILDIQTRTMAARYMDHEFEATHPFLYFVLDTATNVALMAGQIVDPLNSRIY